MTTGRGAVSAGGSGGDMQAVWSKDGRLERNHPRPWVPVPSAIVLGSSPSPQTHRRVTRAGVGVVAVLVVVGVVLRFHADSPMWLDEAISGAIAAGGVDDLVGHLRRDGHPPLYYLALIGWSNLFGDSDTALRALSGVLSVSSLGVCAVMLRRFADRWTALLGVGVLASSPFAVRYATEARMYSLLVLLILLGHLAVAGAWRRPTPWRLAGVTAVTAALLLTHYWTLFLVAVAGLGLCWLWRRGDPASRGAARRLMVAVGLGIVVFTAWFPVFWHQLAHTGTPWSPAPRPTVVAALALEAYGGGRGSEALLVAVATIVIVALGVGSRRSGEVTVLGLTDLPWLRATVLLGLAAMVVGASVSVVGGSAFQGRYAVVAFVPLVAAAAVGLARFTRPVGLVALVLLAGLSWVSVARELSRDRTQVGVIAARVDSSGGVGDPVVFCPDQLAPAGNRLFDDRFVLLAYPTLDPGVSVDWTDYAARNEDADPGAVASAVLGLRPPGGAVWLVWSDGYETFDDQCSRLRSALSAGSSGTARIVHADGDRFFNSANLSRFTG